MAGGAYFLKRRRERRSILGPEVRIDDTTTYREQQDGSRIVTRTTLAKAVRISGHGTATFQAFPTAELTVMKPADQERKDDV